MTTTNRFIAAGRKRRGETADATLSPNGSARSAAT